MGQATSIEWTDFSSNPLRYRDAAGKVVWACAKVSAGCAHCYSEAIAHRYRKGGPFSLAQVKKVTPFIDEKECRRLLTSRKLSGKRVFIGDMTDIFGEWVPFELLDRLFAVFALRPDVTFQILTKRPERMSEYLAARERTKWAEVDCEVECLPVARTPTTPFTFPLVNVWLGTSCEDQATADARIPHLLRCPAAVRFISAEPLLGPIDLLIDGECSSWRCPECGSRSVDPEGAHRDDDLSTWTCPACGGAGNPGEDADWKSEIDWVIIGGESGPGARPCDLAWINSIRKQCESAGCACFVKQLGKCVDNTDPTLRCGGITDPKGGDPSEWHPDLRVREFPYNPRSVTGGFVSKT